MPAPTRQQVLDLGVPPPVAAREPLMVESTVDGSGLILRRAHNLAIDTPITFRAVQSTTTGSLAAALPVPIAEGVTYYVRSVAHDSFQVATAPSPAAPVAAFTVAATGRFHYLVDPGPALDACIGRAWTIVQSDCTAHAGDVEAPLLTDAAAALAARFFIAFLCAADPSKADSYKAIAALYAEVYAPKLEAFFAGDAVRGATDATAGQAENGPTARRLSGVGPFHRPITPRGTIGGPLGHRLGPERDRV